MSKQVTLHTWNINGIEFQASALHDPGYTGCLPAGVVGDPNNPDLFFFSRATLAETELEQLIDEGYFTFFYPQSLGFTAPGCFCLRLAQHLGCFYLVDGNPEIATCFVCNREFASNEDSAVETAPARGPSYASGGEPPEYDFACTCCIEVQRDAGYDYDPCDEELDGFYDDERGR